MATMRGSGVCLKLMRKMMECAADPVTTKTAQRRVTGEEFQVWKLAVRPDRTATLACDDGNGKFVFSKANRVY